MLYFACSYADMNTASICYAILRKKLAHKMDTNCCKINTNDQVWINIWCLLIACRCQVKFDVHKLTFMVHG